MKAIMKHITGFACVILGILVFMMIVAANVFEVFVKTFCILTIASDILWLAIGLTLFFFGKYLLKARRASK